MARIGLMLDHLRNVLGPSGANWLLVIVSGLVFLGLAAVLPGLVNRCRGKDGPPLF